MPSFTLLNRRGFNGGGQLLALNFMLPIAFLPPLRLVYRIDWNTAKILLLPAGNFLVPEGSVFAVLFCVVDNKLFFRRW